MIVKRINLCALDTGSLTLGYVGENDHTQIRINCASVFADYPAAVVSMTVKAPSGVVYPREVETDGQVVIWTITDSDTASAGNGQIQLTFTEDGTIVKTVIAVTTVRASLVGDNPPPDPITDWIDEAGEALAKLEGITASATQLPAGEDPTAEVDVVDGHYNIALGIPGGDAESIIDDTAGAGDTDKTWSADKLTVEFSTVADDVSELKDDLSAKAPVILQTASGDIVSIADGADGMPLSAVVSVEPVQDLHGQSNPYPAGGGKNLLPTVMETIKAINTGGPWNNNVYVYNGITYTVNIDQDGNITGFNLNGTASADSDFYIVSQYTFTAGSYTLNGCPSGGSTSTYRIFATNWGSDTGSGATVTLDGSTSSSIRINIKSGTSVSNQIYKPMVRLSSVTDGTFAPYSNICPITGWTGANVRRTAKNLLDKSSYSVLNNQVIMWGGPATSDADGSFILPAGTYTFSCEETCNGLYVYNRNSRIAVIYNQKSVSFTINEFTAIKLHAYITNSSSTAILARNYQLELGSTATAYEPYIGQTYPISWQTAAGTVYGGTVDTKTGVLTVTHTILEYDASPDEGWLKVDNVTGYYFPGAFPNTVNTNIKPIDNLFKWNSNSRSTMGNLVDGEIAYSPSGEQINIKSSVFSTLDAFKAYLAEHPLRIVAQLYAFAQQTYQLDPVQIATLLGQNNIWADTGAISVTYPADTKLYIQQLTKPTEDDMTANTAITSGKFFMVGNRLFLSTAAIAVGATIIPGTNCTELSLADALNNINA